MSPTGSLCAHDRSLPPPAPGTTARPASVLCLLMVLFLTFATSAHAFTLQAPDKPAPVIYIAPEPAPAVQAAADELARVLGIMTGGKPQILQATTDKIDAKAPGFVIGSLAQSMGVGMTQKSRAGDGYRFKAIGNKVAIVAESDPGLYTGISRFLETLGVGWYVPGPVGEVIPSIKSIDIPDTLDSTGISDSINRRFWYGGKGKSDPATALWLKHTNGDNYESGSWSHAYAHLISKETLKEHPEYGSLFKGKRTTRQLCTSNPQVLEIGAKTILADMAKKDSAMVFNAGPNDGGGLCECEACTAIDTPGYLEPSTGKTNASDRTFLFASAIADITSKTYPNKDLGILVYSDYSRIPKKITLLNPNVFPMIAPIRRCRLHGPDNPNCEMNKLWQEEIDGWAKISPGKLGFYPYNYNLADTLFPLSKVDYYKRLTAQTTKLNITQLAWIFESIDAWSAHAPSLYLSARISWDSHLDIDKEMDRFYKGFYGAAAAPMTSYWTRIDTAIATTNTHTGSSYGMHKIWTPAMLQASRQDIEKAKSLTANDREKEAVAMAEAGLVCAELYIQTWNALAACDFLKAADTQARLQVLIKSMDGGNHTPNWAHERYSYGYFKTFVGNPIAVGEKLLRDGGTILVKLPDTWKFNTDPKAIGIQEAWFSPDFNTSKWRDMGTMSTSWVDEGLIWYAGDAWYQTTFTMPQTPKDADLRLWFGGFDSNVDVYLNGQSLGEKKGFVKSQEFTDIAKHLKPGQQNTLTVRVSSGQLDEIGTGGIMMPVIIYSAKPTSDKQPTETPKDKTKTTDTKYEM